MRSCDVDALSGQVDLALEARHLWQFNYNFRHARNVRPPLNLCLPIS